MLRSNRLVDPLQLAAKATAIGRVLALDNGMFCVQGLLCFVVVVSDIFMSGAEEVESAGDDEANGTDGTADGRVRVLLVNLDRVVFFLFLGKTYIGMPPSPFVWIFGISDPCGP